MARYCRYCGAPVEAGSRFCAGCGKAVPPAETPETNKTESNQQKFCRGCGKPLRPGAAFCRECGRRVSEEGTPAAGRGFPAGAIPPKSPAAPQKMMSKTERYMQNAPQRSRMPQQTGKPGRNSGKAVLAVVVAIALLVCFVYPGFVRTKLFGGGGFGGTVQHASGGSGQQTGGNGAKPGQNAGGNIPPDMNQVPETQTYGDSKPFSIHPREEITISAEADAMDYDREPVFTELSDEKFLELYEQGEETGSILLDAYDFSLGLAEDEGLPGEYVVEYDLAKAGLDEDTWPYVQASRVLADGTREPYFMEREGSVVRCHARRNTIMEWAIILPVLYVGTGLYFEYQNYGEFNKKEHKHADISDDRHIMVLWSEDDFKECSDHHPEIYNPANEKRAELEQKFLDMAEQAYKLEDYGVGPYNGGAVKQSEAVRRMNKDRANAVIGLMKADADYQKYKQIAHEGYPFPIRKTLECFETVWNYLEGPEQGARMPQGRTDIIFKPGKEDADTHKIVHGTNVVINVAIQGQYDGVADPEDPQSRQRAETRLFMTLIHEMFHACQYEYFFYVAVGSSDNAKGTFNTLLMEATAAVVEAEAFRYFQQRGMTPGYEETTVEEAMDPGSGCLTARNIPEYFGIDQDKKYPSSFGNYPGYQWAYLFEYLNKVKEKKKMGEVMSNYYAAGNFSDPILGAYNLTPAQYQALEWEFLHSELRDKIIQKAALEDFDLKEEISVTFPFTKKIKPIYEHSISSRGGYLRIHRFKTTEANKKYALIVLQNKYDESETPGAGEDGQKMYELTPIPWGKGKRTTTQGTTIIDESRNFLFVDPEYLDRDFAILEQAAWVPTDARTGFRAYLMAPPDQPEYELDDKKQNIIVYQPAIPDYSFMKDKIYAEVMKDTGFVIYVKPKGGKKQEFYVPLKGFKGKKPQIKIPVKEIVGDLNPENFDTNVKVTIAEAFRVGEEGEEKIYAGPESEEKDDELLVLSGTWELTIYRKNAASITDPMIDTLGKVAQQIPTGAPPGAIDSINQYLNQYNKASGEIEAQGKKGTPADMIVRPKPGGLEQEYEAVVAYKGTTGAPPDVFEGIFDEDEQKLYLTQKDASAKGSNGQVYDYADFGLLASLTLEVQEVKENDKKQLICSGDMIVDSKIVSYTADVEGRKMDNSYEKFDQVRNGNDTPAVIDREKICPEKSFLKVEKQAEKEQKKHSC